MTKAEKLYELGILGDIRKALGCDPNSNEMDLHINVYSNDMLTRCYCKYHLGNNSWWVSMKKVFDELESLNHKNEKNTKN